MLHVTSMDVKHGFYMLSQGLDMKESRTEALIENYNEGKV